MDLDVDPDLVPLLFPLEDLTFASTLPLGVFELFTSVLYELELLADFPDFESGLGSFLVLVEPEEPEAPAIEGMISPCTFAICSSVNS